MNRIDFLDSIRVKCLIGRTLGSKKAVSPILATLLLMLIAVTAIVVTYAWTIAYTSYNPSQASTTLIEANTYFYNQSRTKLIDVDLLNNGTSDTRIMEVYAGASSSNLQSQVVIQKLPFLVSAEQKQTITLTYDWVNGVTYYFKVLLASGQTLIWSQKAP